MRTLVWKRTIPRPSKAPAGASAEAPAILHRKIAERPRERSPFGPSTALVEAPAIPRSGIAERPRERSPLSRRRFLAASVAAAGAAAVGVSAPFVRRAAASEPLRVSVFGGNFQEAFGEHVYPDFTRETGIRIESIGQKSSEAWVVRLETAARSGEAPADVSILAQGPRLKGQDRELWAPLDEAALPNAGRLPDRFVHRYGDGAISGVGAASWYVTLVTNTDTYPRAPESWKALWDRANQGRIGLLDTAGSSFLLEITAAAWFGGAAILDTEEGILRVIGKVAELKPNVRLWYHDEGRFQRALATGEVPMGQHYHDATWRDAAAGEPVRSTFPVEGGVLDSGSWCVSKASRRIDEAQVFIDYMCRPSIQSKLARRVGTAPLIERGATDLTDEEFGAVASAIPPILPRYDLHVTRGDWLDRKWRELVTG